jgi:hypothetical protein
MEFLALPPVLVIDEDRHHQPQRRQLITEHDDRLMEQWRQSFQGDARDEEAFYAAQREERRACLRRYRAFAEEEVDNLNTTLSDKDPRWDDLWSETTSDDE